MPKYTVRGRGRGRFFALVAADNRASAASPNPPLRNIMPAEPGRIRAVLPVLALRDRAFVLRTA